MEVPIPLAVVAGEYMDSATVVQWLKQPGEPVREGDVLLLVETAKATMEVTAPVSGVLARAAFPAGTDVPVGEVLGWIQTTPGPDARQEDPPARAERPAITPAARRLAAQLGVNLSRLQPTRRDGRITEADVRAAAGGASSATDPHPPHAPAAPGTAEGDAYTVETPTSYRKTTAQRMAASAAIPQFQLTVRAEMGALVQTRRRAGEHRPALTAYFVKAAAEALRRHPRLNSTYEEGALRRFQAINVGVAVATPAGLAVPVIHGADRLSPRDIDAQLADLRKRAVAQQLRIEDVRGGTFTISNLGERGVLQFAALVNPPQTAILAVGTLHTEGENDAPRSLLTLSCDHRALDGMDGAEFLDTLRGLLEQPAPWAGET